MGAAGALIIWYFAPAIVDLFRVQQDRKELVTLTIGLFAFSIPLEFASRSLSGVLEAGQRFDYINGLNLFNTIGIFAVYGVGIWRGADFLVVIYGLLTLRFINLIGYFGMAVCVLPSLKWFRSMRNIQRDYWARASTMIRFGSWIAMASVIGPLLLYFDQWIISIIIGVAFLPFYTVPFNLLTNLGIFPNSLSSTLFPAFSGMEARGERDKIEKYFIRSHRYLLVALIPAAFVLFVWAFEILRLWIGRDFASRATVPLRILVIGYTIGSLAPPSGALLQAVGRPDLLTKLYLIELPVNIAIVWFLTSNFGLPGAALSYSLRTIAETVVLWFILHRVVHFSWERFAQVFVRPLLTIAVVVAAGLVIGEARLENHLAIVWTLLTLGVYCLCMFVFVLDREDKNLIFLFYKKAKSNLPVFR
jgi:O-antigen/teichoic acid export membrane protein